MLLRSRPCKRGSCTGPLPSLLFSPRIHNYRNRIPGECPEKSFSYCVNSWRMPSEGPFAAFALLPGLLRRYVSADCLCVSSTLERVAETRCSRCRGAAACSCVLANLEWTARANRAKPRGTGPGAASATLNGKTRTAQNDLRSARRKPVHRPDNQLSCDSTGLRIKRRTRKQSLFSRQVSQRGPFFSR